MAQDCGLGDRDADARERQSKSTDDERNARCENYAPSRLVANTNDALPSVASRVGGTDVGVGVLACSGDGDDVVDLPVVGVGG